PLQPPAKILASRKTTPLERRLSSKHANSSYSRLKVLGWRGCSLSDGKPIRRKVVPISQYLQEPSTEQQVKSETDWPLEDLVDIQRWLRWADTALNPPKTPLQIKSCPSRKKAA